MQRTREEGKDVEEDFVWETEDHRDGTEESLKRELVFCATGGKLLKF